MKVKPYPSHLPHPIPPPRLSGLADGRTYYSCLMEHISVVSPFSKVVCGAHEHCFLWDSFERRTKVETVYK